MGSISFMIYNTLTFPTHGVEMLVVIVGVVVGNFWNAQTCALRSLNDACVYLHYVSTVCDVPIRAWMNHAGGRVKSAQFLNPTILFAASFCC